MKKRFKWNHQHNVWLVLVLIVGVCFGIYIQTAANYPTGTADSDELIGVSYAGGALHASGYPILRLMLMLATRVLVWWPVALRANMVAVVLHSLTAGLIFLTARKLLLNLYPKTKDELIMLSAMASTLMFSFSYLFWFYAGVIEVITLTSFLMMLTLYLGVLIHNQKNINLRRKLWYTLFGIIGLGISHHHLFVLIVPSVVVLCYKVFGNEDKKYLLFAKGVGVAISVFVAAYLTLNIGNAKPIWTWRIKPQISGMIEYISRADFSGNFVELGIEKSAYISKVDIQAALLSIGNYYSEIVPTHFHWLFLLFTFIGLMQTIKLKRKRNIRNFLVVLYVITTLFLVGYIQQPVGLVNTRNFAQQVLINERFYLMGYLTLPLFAGIGILKVFKIISRVINDEILIRMAGILLLVIILQTVSRYWPKVSMKDYRAVYDYADTVLSNTQTDGVVVCNTDITCFSLLYMKVTEPLYKDINVVTITPQIRTINADNLFRFDYPDNPFRMADVMAWNMENEKQVIISDIDPMYFDLFGMDAKIFMILPYHGGFELVCNNEVTFEDESFRISYRDADKHNSSTRLFSLFMSEYHTTAATLLGRLGEKQLALANINQGLILNGESETLHDLQKELDEYKGDEGYLTFNACPDINDIDSMEECGSNTVNCNLRIPLWKTMIDPVNAVVRYEWAEALEAAGLTPLAKREYKNVLKLDTNYVQANMSLIRLEEVEDLSDEL